MVVKINKISDTLHSQQEAWKDTALAVSFPGPMLQWFFGANRMYVFAMQCGFVSKRNSIMIRSLFTGVTGLKNFQTKMDVISNNISNVNTTAFKRGRVMFADLFSQTIKYGQQAFGDYGSQNPQQVGLGVKTASIDTLMGQGNIETTGKDTDIAIEGEGFLVVSSYDGCTYYTRDGNLNISDNYDMVMTNTGSKIQGWMAVQNPKTGNLEMKETGVVPEDINIAKYLKKHAHQTNEIKYSCNLNAGSDERDIQFGLNTLTFFDDQGNQQNLQFKFKKLDANNWVWSAYDDSEGFVATGTLKCNEDGEIIESTVEPEGQTSTIAQPYFTYDPDGDPRPGSATMPINAVSNTGNGVSSGVTVYGKEVQDETVQVIFDGGDPTKATSYRVVGSVRGFIGSGVLGGEQARFKGEPTGIGTYWTPDTDTSFTITDTQIYTLDDGTEHTEVTFPREATITFTTAGGPYSTSQIVDNINEELKNNGVRATAYYDAVTQNFQIVANSTGSNRELKISNATGSFTDLGLSEGVERGTGGSKAEVFQDVAASEAAIIAAGGAAGDADYANDHWDPASDVKLMITDRHGNATQVTFNDYVAGVNQVYSRGAILAEINSKLAQDNVDATATFDDTDNDGNPDMLVIKSNTEGCGECLYITGSNIDQLGLTAGVSFGTAAVSTFDNGGLSFSLTEGKDAWLPNESLSFDTTSEKGAASSVNIFVPQPSSKTLTFKTEVDGETYKIDGAVAKGAQHSTNIVVYDSLGAAHALITRWEHTNKDTMEWSYKISYSNDDPEIIAWCADPANGVIDPENPTEDELERANDALIRNREGKMYFNEVGKINLGKSYIPTLSMTPEGSNEVNISLIADLITQFDSDFTTKAESQDGYAMGLLEQIYFEDDGIVRGVYSNGQKQPIAQVAIATFNNPAGLELQGNNLYAYSPSSGLAVVTKAGIGKAGVICPASLEMSNVDISEEFTNMIVTQRAFQANSRVITTSDEILQEVVNLKR